MFPFNPLGDHGGLSYDELEARVKAETSRLGKEFAQHVMAAVGPEGMGCSIATDEFRRCQPVSYQRENSPVQARGPLLPGPGCFCSWQRGPTGQARGSLSLLWPVTLLC